MASQRIGYIDALRGMTMVLVVFGHVIYDTFAINPDELALPDFFLSFRMPMFFFISGFIACRPVDYFTKTNFIKSLRHKAFVQLVPVTIVFTVCAFAHNVNPVKFFLEFGFHGYWFTEALFEMFLIYFFIAFCGSRMNSWKFILYSLITLSMIGNVMYFIFHLSDNILAVRILLLINIAWFFQFFAFGIICRHYQDKFLCLMKNKYVITTMFSLFTAAFLYVRIPNINIEQPMFYGLMHSFVIKYLGLLSVFAIFANNDVYFDQESKVSQIFRFVGRRTLDIYLIHYFLLPNFRQYRDLFTGSHSELLILVVCGSIALIITACCLLVSKVIRTSPILAKYVFGVTKQI